MFEVLNELNLNLLSGELEGEIVKGELVNKGEEQFIIVSLLEFWSKLYKSTKTKIFNKNAKKDIIYNVDYLVMENDQKSISHSWSDYPEHS